MHIDMHVISVKFSFQFANTVIVVLEPPIPKIHVLPVVFHLQTSGLVCSNFVLKQINNIVQDNSVKVTETYFTVFL